MPSDNDGIMVILSSPSGAGKTTLVNLLSKKDNFEVSISHTTRQPRPGEVPHKDYYFVNDKEFRRLINNQEFLEYAKVFKNYYGSLKDSIIKNLNEGESIIFDIDWQGTKQIKKKKLKYKIITVFILPPSKKELFNRLLKRDKKDKRIAHERMKQFKKDVMHWKEYDYAVINDKVETCYKSIINFINIQKKQKKLLKYNKQFIRSHIKYLLN